mgnify:CR=1 FL=1
MAGNLGKYLSGVTLLFSVRSEAIFFFFIYEEAVQGLGMACYSLKQAKHFEEAAEIAALAIEHYCDPMIDLCKMDEETERINAGPFIYPMNKCFVAFFEAMRDSFQLYVDRKFDDTMEIR